MSLFDYVQEEVERRYEKQPNENNNRRMVGGYNYNPSFYYPIDKIRKEDKDENLC